MIINNNMARSIDQINRTKQSPLVTPSKKTSDNHQGFDAIFKQELDARDSIKFSKHANSRLHSRNITLSDGQLQRLEMGVSTAKNKGVKESLMLMDDIALVVNVDKATVITALNKDETQNHVFTNIDGALLL